MKTWIAVICIVMSGTIAWAEEANVWRISAQLYVWSERDECRTIVKFVNGERDNSEYVISLLKHPLAILPSGTRVQIISTDAGCSKLLWNNKYVWTTARWWLDADPKRSK